jgi:hypothetical protein
LRRFYTVYFRSVLFLQFTIGTAQFVTLDVYDVLGRTVQSLVNTTLDAGTYTIQWNAAGVPGGVYYCAMKAGKYSAMQKMVLQK